MYMSKLKKGKNKFGLKQIASLVHFKKKKWLKYQYTQLSTAQTDI